MEKIDITDHVEIRIYLPFESAPESIIKPNQQHGNNIVEIVTGEENLNDCDALVTDKKGIEIGVGTADCAPICFVGQDKVGIAHIGWRGLCLGLIEKMLEQFNQGDIKIYVGPHINVFEIQKDFCYGEIKEKFGTKFFMEDNGKTFFRFTDAVLSLLPGDVILDLRDTGKDVAFPSYRKNKTKERFITTVRFE